MNLTLILPGGLPPPELARDLLATPRLRACASQRTPLSQWTAHGRVETISLASGEDAPGARHTAWEAWLAARFGLIPQASETPPGLAAWAAAGDGLDSASGQWWFADPVHLQLGRDHLVLTDPAALQLQADEAQALAAAVAELLAEEALSLHAGASGRWYVRADHVLNLTTTSLGCAIGRNIDLWQARGDDARRWRRLLNEWQMTWFAHPVNEQREQSGLPTVNSVWLHGGGQRIGATGQGIAATLGDDPVLRGLAQCTGLVHADHGDPLTVALLPGADTLVRLNDLLEAAMAADWGLWVERLADLDQTLFSAIDASLKPRGCQRLQLVLLGEQTLRTLSLRPADRWKLWQRQPLSALLG